MNRPIAPSFITSVPSPSRSNWRGGQSQPAKATTIIHQDQTHVSTRCLSSAGISTWPWKPKNWATFQAHWESIEATCLGASIARKIVGSRPHGTSWTRSRSSSRARSAWRQLWSVLLHRRGGQKTIGLRHLLAAVQRSVRSAGLVPGGLRRGGPVYVCEGGEHFLALVPGVGQGPNGMPLDPEVRRLLDHVS